MELSNFNKNGDKMSNDNIKFRLIRFLSDVILSDGKISDISTIYDIRIKNVKCAFIDGINNLSVDTTRWLIRFEFNNRDDLVINYDENIDMIFTYSNKNGDLEVYSINDEFLEIFLNSDLTNILIDWLTDYIKNRINSEPFVIEG